MLLSCLWAGLIAVSVAAAKLTGAHDLTSAALDGAAQGVQLALKMAGAICLWSGLTNVLRRSGVTALLSRLLRPLLRRLYPDAADDPETLAAVSGNFTANLLGLGNAATPPGIEAVRRIRLRAPDSRATDEMCRLIVLNSASIQLIPATVIALRASLGAPAPADLLPAVWITSLCSAGAGVGACLLFGGVRRG